MSTWFGISTEFTLKPDHDPAALTAAIVAYNDATIPTAARLVDAETLRVETEGEMGCDTPDRLQAGLADLVARFGDGQPVKVSIVSEYDYAGRSYSYWLGPKAAVLVALAQELAWRRETLTAAYDRQIALLANTADDAFVATEGW
jgi:hypothetical protein